MSDNSSSQKNKWSLSEALCTALQSKTNDELIELVVNEAKRNDRYASELVEKFKVAKPLSELISTTKSAIATATNFDERDRNHNFDIDYEAYTMVQRNFQQLVDGNHIDTALELAVELMKQGSYQVEGSDEGLMTEEIEECFEVITKEIYKSSVHKGSEAEKIKKWCRDLSQADRVGFIFEEKINKLKSDIRLT